jgi:hypothetical protein
MTTPAIPVVPLQGLSILSVAADHSVPSTMGQYTLNINASNAARQAWLDEGYKLIVAKGVSRDNGPPNYNAAWIVIPVNEAGPKITISWDVSYQAGYTTERIVNGADIHVTGDPIQVTTGGYYVVDRTGSLVPDLNIGVNASAPGFTFLNDEGYKTFYHPVLLCSNNNSKMVPLWAADSGTACATC